MAVNFREQLRASYYLAGDEERRNEAGRFPIYYNNANYLAKMCTDTTFLCDTEYSRLFNISRKNDPFLITAAAPYARAKGVSKYCFIPMLTPSL